jgi:hypothetical protein
MEFCKIHPWPRPAAALARPLPASTGSAFPWVGAISGGKCRTPQEHSDAAGGTGTQPNEPALQKKRNLKMFTELPDGVFANQNPNFGKFWKVLDHLAMEDVGIIDGHLVYFVVICIVHLRLFGKVFSHFGMLYQEKFDNPVCSINLRNYQLILITLKTMKTLLFWII